MPMAEEKINSLTVIYGFYKLLSSGRPDYESLVDEEVNK